MLQQVREFKIVRCCGTAMRRISIVGVDAVVDCCETLRQALTN
ncbi:hypothetical protein ACWGLF_46005 [Streptomyces puniciscabiei]